MIQFWMLMATIWVVFLWDIYLVLRQYRVHRNTVTRPESVAEIITEEEFVKARLYRLDKHHFSILRCICGQLQLTALLMFEVFVFLWSLSGSLSEKIGFSNEMAQSVTFVSITTLIETILSLPWQIYDTFVIEEKHGFNKQTLGFFLKDKAKKTLVGLIILIPVTVAVIYIVENGGQYFFFYVWVFLSIVLFLLMTIYPEFIAPLFDVYTPLPESELRSKIAKLARDCHFPLKKLFVVHGSRRSAHSNAYMYGIWNNKRIVLYDTLLSKELNAKLKELGSAVTEDSDKKEEENKSFGLPDDQVVAVLGHELGHWYFFHNAINIIMTEVYLLGLLLVFHFCYNDSTLFEAFGFYTSRPTIIAFIIVFQYIMAPYDEFVAFIMTMISRRMEFSADKFSRSLGHGNELCAALMKIGRNNLSLPVDDPLYSMFNHSHPSIPERIAALRDKKLE